MQCKTKFIVCKQLALQEAVVSMHYKYIESFKSYCRLLSRSILIAEAQYEQKQYYYCFYKSNPNAITRDIPWDIYINPRLG